MTADAIFLHTEDHNQDGTADAKSWVIVKYTAEDVDEDGTWDYEDLLIWKHTETSP